MTAARAPRSISPVTAYAERVVAGEIVAGRLVHLACERHLRDLETAAERGLWFDDDAAQHAIEFFSFIRHSKGEWAGQPLVLEPWQCFIVGSIFGWKVTTTGLRRFRNGYVEVPRKNGKSTLTAGIGLYLLLADGEPGAEIYCAATKLEQAEIIHGEATRMVRASPALRRLVSILANNLNVPATASKFEPLSGAPETHDGLNIHGGLIDELHAHKDRLLVDVLETATGSRRQPLIFMITTAGYDRLSVCWERHAHAEQVLDGTLDDDTTFGYIATADEGDDWTLEETWRKANPNHGISVKPDDLKRKAARAKAIPGEQNGFKRLHLNIWTEQATRAIDAAAWLAGAGVRDWRDLAEAFTGRPCWLGVDLSSTTDLTAVAALFRDGDDWAVVPRFWLPGQDLRERGRRDLAPYETWGQQGALNVIDGNVIDYDAIDQVIDELLATYEVRELGYDPWNATQWVLKQQAKGVIVTPVRQGFASLTAPTKELLTLVTSGRLHHGNHPILTWNAANLQTTQDPAGNLKPDKAQTRRRIDGIVATIVALARALADDGGSTSVYEDAGLIVL